MAEEKKDIGAGDVLRRERSKIGFPYVALNDAVDVAQAIFEHGGQQGTTDQLAAWLKHETVESGTFKIKILAARMFGLVRSDGDTISLTDLGSQIVDPKTEHLARAQAFLRVPLYRAIYEKYKGHLLPGDTALEAEMVTLGVASKQKARARQGFQRSAEQANLFALGKDRLVLPSGVSLDSTTPPNGEKGRKMEQVTVSQTCPSEINPLIAALIEDLPATGEWTRDEHDLWARVFLRTVDKLYKVKE